MKAEHDNPRLDSFLENMGADTEVIKKILKELE